MTHTGESSPRELNPPAALVVADTDGLICRWNDANIPVLCADGVVRRWPGRFTLIRDARGRPAGAAAVLVPPAGDDPPLFDL
jgi:hypothetical protein